MIELSERLEKVASYVRRGARLADIGSDHAFLPISLYQRDLISFAVAGEVVKGPYERAVNEVERNQLTAAVEVRFGDGLAVVQPEDAIDTVTICGMGGSLIKSILDKGLKNGNLKKDERLILQPNVREDVLREFLHTHKYNITAEAILEENNKIYEIIVAEPVKEAVQYTKEEIKYGPILLEERSREFIKKWTFELYKLQNVINQLNLSNTDQEEKIKDLQKQINEIQEMIV